VKKLKKKFEANNFQPIFLNMQSKVPVKTSKQFKNSVKISTNIITTNTNNKL